MCCIASVHLTTAGHPFIRYIWQSICENTLRSIDAVLQECWHKLPVAYIQEI